MMCDVYVYADCMGGYTIHVASNRLVIPPIPNPPFSMIIVKDAKFDKQSRKLVYRRKIDSLIAAITSRLYIWLSKPNGWSLAIIPRKPIGLQHDGEWLYEETALECADRLRYLKDMGYHVPQYAIDALVSESLTEEYNNGIT